MVQARKFQSQKEADEAMKALLIQQRRKLAAEARAQKAQNRRAQAEAKKALTTPKKKQSDRLRTSTVLPTAARRSHKASNVLESDVAVAIAQEPILATSRGRKVQRPQRFNC